MTMGKTFVVTEKVYLSLADGTLHTAKYHAREDCSRLTCKKAVTTCVTEQEIVDSNGKLLPCASCCVDKPSEKERHVGPASDKALPPTIFPYCRDIKVWTCSDGKEFYDEAGQIKGQNEALWYELELRRNGKKK